MPDYTPYVQYARQQAAQRRRQTADRYEQAWAVARRVADFLRDHYDPTRVMVFVSLLHPERFHLQSDIDLAVDGIPWPEYLRAWNEVEELAPAFKIDLLDIAIVSASMRQQIEGEG